MTETHYDVLDVADGAVERTWLEISGFRQETAGDATMPAHHHLDHELVLATRGRLSVSAAGGAWTVGAGTALWMPARVPHTVRFSAEAVILGVHVSPRIVTAGVRWARPHAVETDPALPVIVDRLGGRGLTDRARGRTTAVLLDLLSESTISGGALPVPRDPRAATVAASLLDDPSDPRELRRWADELQVSTRTLARAFRTDTGLTFSAWRTRARIGAATGQLSEGVPVAEVARRVGYGNVSAFIAAFRDQIGVTPGEYARREGGGREVRGAVGRRTETPVV